MNAVQHMKWCSKAPPVNNKNIHIKIALSLGHEEKTCNDLQGSLYFTGETTVLHDGGSYCRPGLFLTHAISSEQRIKAREDCAELKPC